METKEQYKMDKNQYFPSQRCTGSNYDARVLENIAGSFLDASGCSGEMKALMTGKLETAIIAAASVIWQLSVIWMGTQATLAQF